MSSDGSIELEWADKRYRFRLAFGQLCELQQLRNAGAIEIMTRLAERRWYVEDIREIIRVGLIGGGMNPTEARVLVTLYIEQRPPMESEQTAMLIIGAAMAGVPRDQPVSKPKAEESTATDGSASPRSTEREPSSAGPQERSTSLAFGSSP
jgi:Phage tail tube protein, GTA-gp10